MGIPLRVISHPPDPDGFKGHIRHVPGSQWDGLVQPGDMWREPASDRDGRDAWMIALPNLEIWCTTDAVPASGMWDVSGEPPAITVHPSINCLGAHPWHGFITNGELVG